MGSQILTFDAIRGIAGVSGKPNKAEAVKEFLDQVKEAKDAINISREIDKLPTNEIKGKLTALATLLSLAIKDPKLEMLIADIEFATSSVYNNITRRVSLSQIDRLTSLTEEQLKSLQRLNSLLRKHVKQLQEAKQELATLPDNN